VRDWPAGGKRAAVVHVEPVAEPPCVTTDGQVFQRVAGATKPVSEATELRRLYERGEAKVARAEAVALRALDAAVANTQAPRSDRPSLLLGLAVAPVGTAVDIAARVFAPGIDVKLMGGIDGLPHEPLFFEDGPVADVRAPGSRVTQDAVTVATSPGFAQSWQLRVAWDGSAAAVLRAVSPQEIPEQRIVADSLFDETVGPMATVVEKTARDVGGHGRAHVVLQALAWQFSVIHAGYTRGIPDLAGVRPIQRWASGDVWLDEQLLASMKREFLRTCGIPEWEPAADT
jgi:hypothetical protein